MDIHVNLQSIRPMIRDSFKALIQDELVSDNIIKIVDKNFDGDYNGSVDKFAHVITDHNEKWTLENDDIARICLRACFNKGNLSHYKVMACCRISLNTDTKYFALVKHDDTKEWLEVHGMSSELFEVIDSDKHGKNNLWGYIWEKYDIIKLTKWLLRQ